MRAAHNIKRLFESKDIAYFDILFKPPKHRTQAVRGTFNLHAIGARRFFEFQ